LPPVRPKAQTPRTIAKTTFQVVIASYWLSE
jgi:hypothetical protein